jgi:DNA polymerase-4
VAERERKSLSAERTFSTDVTTDSAMQSILSKIALEVSDRLKKGSYKGRTITLKIKYFDFELHTRSRTIETYTDDPNLILDTVMELLMADFPLKAIRLLGINVSKLGQDVAEENVINQLTLGF